MKKKIGLIVDFEVYSRFRAMILRRYGKIHCKVGEVVSDLMDKWVENCIQQQTSANIKTANSKTKRILGLCKSIEKSEATCLNDLHLKRLVQEDLWMKGDQRTVRDYRVHLIREGVLRPGFNAYVVDYTRLRDILHQVNCLNE